MGSPDIKNIMITVYWKDKVHYTRDRFDDSLIEDVMFRVQYELEKFGTTCYAIDWGAECDIKEVRLYYVRLSNLFDRVFSHFGLLAH